jgi:hypothetical protein
MSRSEMSAREAVARGHLAKMDRLAVIETADGVKAEEGRSSDRAMVWAERRLMAECRMAFSSESFRSA